MMTPRVLVPALLVAGPAAAAPASGAMSAGLPALIAAGAAAIGALIALGSRPEPRRAPVRVKDESADRDRAAPENR